MKHKCSSASQGISRILYNLNVHYPVHNSLPTVPFMVHINPFQSLLSDPTSVNVDTFVYADHTQNYNMLL